MRRRVTVLGVCALIAGRASPIVAAVLVTTPPAFLRRAVVAPSLRPGVVFVFNKQNPNWSTEGRAPTHPFHKPYKPLYAPPGALPEHPGGSRHASQFISQQVLVTLTACFILAVGAHWVSAMLRLPSAPLLVLLGVVVGPATQLLDPDLLFGHLLLPLVSLCLAVLLFQQALALRISALRELGGLMTTGLLATWLLGAIAAHLLLRIDPSVAVLLGLVLVMTASPVIVPMLRAVDADGSDPAAVGSDAPALEVVGALLFSIVFCAILAGGSRGSGIPTLVGILKAVLAGIIAGGLGARALMLLLQDDRLVPPPFVSAASLVVLGVVFTGANLVQEQSGLIAAMVMGIAFTAQRSVNVEPLRRSKRSIDTLLGPVLLLLLTARLELGGLEHFAVPALVFVIFAMLVARPIAVALATWHFGMTTRERLFLACAAPRGIVPAALVSVLGMRLLEIGYKDAKLLLPLTILLIATTSATAALAGWLGAGKAARAPSGAPQPESAAWPNELTAEDAEGESQAPVQRA